MSTISSGKKGKETPLGYWKVFRKQVKGFSRKYDNAPMPFMQRLTWDGIALHAGCNPGFPASHGCIRMLIPDVIDLYDQVPVGAPVYIA